MFSIPRNICGYKIAQAELSTAEEGCFLARSTDAKAERATAHRHVSGTHNGAGNNQTRIQRDSSHEPSQDVCRWFVAHSPFSFFSCTQNRVQSWFSFSERHDKHRERKRTLLRTNRCTYFGRSRIKSYRTAEYKIEWQPQCTRLHATTRQLTQQKLCGNPSCLRTTTESTQKQVNVYHATT